MKETYTIGQTVRLTLNLFYKFSDTRSPQNRLKIYGSSRDNTRSCIPANQSKEVKRMGEEMKRNMFVYTIVSVFFVLIHSAAYAAVWRVNPIESAGADFTSINSAIASVAVVNGDTLYLEGSGVSLSTTAVSVTKTLNIIGPGYFLDEYSDTQANIAPATISHRVTMSPGSSGSLIQGVTFTEAYLDINTPDIIIKRCKLRRVRVGYSAVSDNTIIMQNYLGLITVGNLSEQVVITNNIIYGEYGAVTVSSGCTVGISNNVIQNGDMVINDSTVDNNIFFNGEFNWTNTTFHNNIGNSDQFGTENGNLSNVVMNDIFLFVGTTDGQYQLATGSPAIGAGVNGVDCGAFGGDTPYILAGIPDYPSIYYFTSPLTTTHETGLPVRIKTRVNN